MQKIEQSAFDASFDNIRKTIRFCSPDINSVQDCLHSTRIFLLEHKEFITPLNMNSLFMAFNGIITKADSNSCDEIFDIFEPFGFNPLTFLTGSPYQWSVKRQGIIFLLCLSEDNYKKSTLYFEQLPEKEKTLIATNVIFPNYTNYMNEKKQKKQIMRNYTFHIILPLITNKNKRNLSSSPKTYRKLNDLFLNNCYLYVLKYQNAEKSSLNEISINRRMYEIKQQTKNVSNIIKALEHNKSIAKLPEIYYENKKALEDNLLIEKLIPKIHSPRTTFKKSFI